MFGLSNNADEMMSAYKEKVQHLAEWCISTNLLLNTHKTKELIVDFQHTKRNHAHTSIHIYIETEPLESWTSFKFLGVHISDDLTFPLLLVKEAYYLFFSS